MRKMIRQGDVLMIQIDAEPETEEMPADPRGLVVAEGETSGHCHILYGSGAKLVRFRDGTGRLVAFVPHGGEVRVVGGGVAGVDRHTAVKLSPGKYELRVQRSWTAEQYSVPVAD